MSADIFVSHNLERVLVACGGRRPGCQETCTAQGGPEKRALHPTAGGAKRDPDTDTAGQASAPPASPCRHDSERPARDKPSARASEKTPLTLPNLAASPENLQHLCGSRGCKTEAPETGGSSWVRALGRGG